jgi:hypothetical protein
MHVPASRLAAISAGSCTLPLSHFRLFYYSGKHVARDGDDGYQKQKSNPERRGTCHGSSFFLVERFALSLWNSWVDNTALSKLL